MSDLARRARELALLLASWPSVTGTPEEARFAARLGDLLRPLMDVVEVRALPGDGLGRANVLAAKRGEGRQAILLSGHFDTVPFADYGSLAPLACSPCELRAAIIARLQASGEHPLALADLQSGAFLPGRGLLDMKAGLAAGIAAMAAHRGAGTVLLVATPDEEDRSAGMRAAVAQVAQMASELDLDIRLAVNLDAISDQGDGSAGRVVALGSIGKQLLTALAVGQEAHACYPQDGVNAAYLAAELVTEFELAPELAETSGDETAAPPTALHAKDLKSGYNVTTPGRAWAYWNTLQHRRSAGDVLEIASVLARRAMRRAEAKVGRAIPVITYAELAAGVRPGPVADKAHELATADRLDLPERARLVTDHVWLQSGRSGPAVILGLGSIPYPAVALADQCLEATVLAAVRPFGLGAVRYFPGISDMSFLGAAHGDPAVAAANLPIAGTSFDMPRPAGYPCINIGPWGRDYHHWLERLHAPYAFAVLPRVLSSVIAAVLKEPVS